MLEYAIMEEFNLPNIADVREHISDIFASVDERDPLEERKRVDRLISEVL